MLPNSRPRPLRKFRPSLIHVCLPALQARLAILAAIQNRFVEKKESARCDGATNVIHHIFFGIEFEVVKGKTEVNKIKTISLYAEISPEILETKIPVAPELPRVSPGGIQRLSGKINSSVKLHRCFSQHPRGCPSIPRSQIQKPESAGRSRHFAPESRFDFAVMERVVLDAEAIDLPMREKISDRALHSFKIQPGSNTTNCCRPL